jgi:hypothetical protein
MENRLKNPVLAFGLVVGWIAGSLSGPVCRADDSHDLPEAPAAAVTGRACRETHVLLPCVGGSGQASAETRPVAVPAAARAPEDSRHRFWDRQNVVLFSLVGASRALDYSSTLNMRRRGLQEILLTNDIVDQHAAFAAIEAGGTAVSIGASYLFHRYQHHRLERWNSIIHASLGTTGAVRNYCLKTAHPSTSP